MQEIPPAHFAQIEMRVGRVRSVAEFPEARQPSYLLEIDFGAGAGSRKSAAALAEDYRREDLLDRLIVAVVNFPPKQIANHISEVLVLAAANEDGSLHLLAPDPGAELGARIR